MNTRNSAHSASNAIYDKTKTIVQAKAYIEQGFSIVPVGFCTKKPKNDWGSETLAASDVERFFSQPCNIGIALGERSGNLVDVDIDDDAAARLAQILLPETGMIFGRKSRRRTHWIYRCRTDKTRQFQGLKGMIIEIRGKGGQTVFPGSVHESGETIQFDKDGQPTHVTAEILDRACRKISIGTTLLGQWHKSTRHSLALATAGLLAKSKWDEAEALTLIEAVAMAAADEEIEDRRQCVADTYASLGNGKPIEGYEKLVELLGRKAADLLAKWSGSSPQRSNPSPAGLTGATLTLLELKSEIRSAGRFAAEHANELIYCEGQKGWFARDNTMWRKAGPAEIQGYGRRFCLKETLPLVNLYPPEAVAKLETKRRIDHIVDLSREELSIADYQLDCDPYRLGLKDGCVYDLQQQAICNGPDSIVTMRINATFDPDADCPIWRQFIRRIFNDDDEVIAFVQRAVGYSLTGETTEQCMFVLLGSGANGKSTFLNAIADLLGEYSAVTPMKTLMLRQYGNDQNDDLARLVRKRFVSASEGETGQRLAEAKIKNMTGGDKLTCRALWQNLFEYKPEFKLWLATNSLPDVNGADEAISRRIHLIDFPVKIPTEERDLQMPQKLAGERSGILNWAIEGYRQWKSQGRLNPPDRIHGSTHRYLQDNDTVEQFIETCCVRAPRAVGMSKDLYDRYRVWAEASSYEPLHINTFGKTLGKKGFKRENKRIGSAWKGLDLRSDLGE